MARRHLRQLANLCTGHGACRWSRRTTIGPPRRACWSLLAEADPAEAGVLWDVEHPYRRGERPADTAAGLRPYLRHTHFKDSGRGDGKSLPRLWAKGTCR